MTLCFSIFVFACRPLINFQNLYKNSSHAGWQVMFHSTARFHLKVPLVNPSSNAKGSHLLVPQIFQSKTEPTFIRFSISVIAS